MLENVCANPLNLKAINNRVVCRGSLPTRVHKVVHRPGISIFLGHMCKMTKKVVICTLNIQIICFFLVPVLVQ